jgi:hypothetical protein
LKWQTASSKDREERQSFPGDSDMITFRLVTAFVGLLLVAACGSSAGPKSASPPEVLLAVVEGGSVQSQPGTVAIVGLDGRARATANFQARVGPVIPDAYTPLQGVAQVTGSGVYYIDGGGVVRELRVGSEPRVIARFALQPTQEDAWFSVSPDGTRVLAGIVTFPALGPIIPGTSWNSLVGPTKFDLETGSAGGQSKVLAHLESPQGDNGPPSIFPIRWTSVGSVGVVPQYLTSQNIWRGGRLYLIDDLGKPTQQLGGSDCYSASITSTGFIPCATDTTEAVSVRDQAGKVVWTTHVEAFTAWKVRVSQDGQAILNDSQVETHTGGIVPMPEGFKLQGWLDANTVVGRVQQQNGDEGNLLWISLADPTRIHDLGFKGDFVSTLG